MRKLASIQKIDSLSPISGADKIELARVKGWQVVVEKNKYKAGDHVIYFEIDSFLPIDPRFEFLRKSCLQNMGGEEGFRIRTVRLRGQLSQGMVMPVKDFLSDYELSEDVTERLGVKKWSPPVPTAMNGKVIGPFPAFIPKTDQERIQNLADRFEEFSQIPFYWTEKLDGCSCTFFLHEGQTGVCSRNWQLDPDDDNVYTKIFHKIKFNGTGQEASLAIQGEIIGPGIQGNKYKLSDHEFYVFDIYDIKNGTYVNKRLMQSMCSLYGFTCVPFVEPNRLNLSHVESIDDLILLAEGKSKINPGTTREGLVLTSDGGSLSFKVINNEFLLRNRE